MSLLRKLFGRAPNSDNTRTEKPIETPLPKPLSPIEMTDKTFRFIAIDVETANSDAGSICQIGLAGVDRDGTIQTISLYINPNDLFDDFNIELHGIDQDTVMDAAQFADAIVLLRPFLERHPLVQHSSFDQKALDRACAMNDIPKIRANWHDSVRIARRAWPQLKGQGGHGLANLKKHLSLEFEHHDAGEDARAAAEIVLLSEQETGETFDVLSSAQRQKAFPTTISIEGDQNGPLYGHVACFTGALTMSRTEASTLAAGAGISVRASVSKKTSLLVVGDQDLALLAGHVKSSKHRRAEELQAEGHAIRIVGETEFLTLLKP